MSRSFTSDYYVDTNFGLVSARGIDIRKDTDEHIAYVSLQNVIQTKALE